MKPWPPIASDVSIDPRLVSRLEISVAAQFVTAEGSQACIIEDISPTGARVVGMAGASPGEAGILRCRELDILSEVRWQSNRETGLHFAEPILDGETDEHSLEDMNFEEAQRRANNRRFFRLIWTMA